MFKSKSKLPLILTTIYLIIALLAFSLMIATIDTDNMSAIFVVLVAIPWSALILGMLDYFGVNSLILNQVLMAIGTAINALIIYTFFSFITRNKT